MKEKLTNIGACRFCGQLTTLEKEMTEMQANERATMECYCDRAMEYQKETVRKEKAMENVSTLFGEGAPKEKRVPQEIVEILKRGVEIIYMGSLAKITLNLRGGGKGHDLTK